MHEITLHLKYAYEAICYHEGHKRSRVKAKNLEDLPLYSLSEARTLADLSAKYLKANLDSGTEIKTLIVLECSETTVSPMFSDSIVLSYCTIRNIFFD